MTYSRPWMFVGLSLMASGAIMLWQQDQQRTAMADPPKAEAKPSAAAGDACPWKSLFDGKTLNGWKAPDFGGQGKVYVQDGAIVMDMGALMTGVTWTGPVIRDNYELELEGMRATARILLHDDVPRRQGPLFAGRRRLGRQPGRTVEHRLRRRLGERDDPNHGLQERQVVQGADSRERRCDRGLDRRQTDRQPAAKGPQVLDPHRGGPVPSAGHFHLGHQGRRTQHPRPGPQA